MLLKFASAIKSTVQEGLKAQLKTFYSEGIRKLMERWPKCIKKLYD